MNWEVKNLSDVVELRRGFDLPHAERRRGDVPIISAGQQVGAHDVPMVKGPGFAVGRATNLGVPTWSEGDYWPLNTTLYAADFKGNDPAFLYRLFQVLDLTGFDSGSVQPMLNRNYIARVLVKVPCVREQRAIAEVLGAVDDKIAANATLRETAAQFSKARYRALLSADVHRVTVADACALVSRGASPRYMEDASATLVLNQKCVRDGWVDLGPARLTDPNRVRAGTLLQAHDVLVNSTGMGTLGRVAAWNRPDVATVDSHITIARPDPDVVDPAVFGVAMRELESDIEGLAEGSTGQTELSRQQLGALAVPMPARSRQGELGSIIRSLAGRSLAAAEESRQLAALRDALLPELMSGRLRVKDAEKTVEEVV